MGSEMCIRDSIIIDSFEGNTDTDISTPATYVIFGKENVGNSSSIDLRNLTAEDGFVLKGGDRISATSVSNAGDINGDGFDDLIIGAGFDGTNNQIIEYEFLRNSYISDDGKGRSFIVFGNEDIGTSGEFDLSNLCLLYTSPSPRDLSTSRMPSSA